MICVCEKIVINIREAKSAGNLALARIILKRLKLKLS